MTQRAQRDSCQLCVYHAVAELDSGPSVYFLCVFVFRTTASAGDSSSWRVCHFSLLAQRKVTKRKGTTHNAQRLPVPPWQAHMPPARMPSLYAALWVDPSPPSMNVGGLARLNGCRWSQRNSF